MALDKPQQDRTRLLTFLNSIALILGATLFCLGGTPGPEEFLRVQMHLSPSQIADIRNGQAVAKILPSPNPSDIFVFGAVYVHAKPVAYLQLMRDIARLSKLSGYLGAGEFSKSPTIGDLAGLSLDNDDIEDLKNCRPGNCDLQLPEESMEAARASIDWSSPDVVEQVNNLAKRRIMRLLEDYQHSGDRALGTYRDKRDPLPVAEQFRSLLSRVELFPQYLPDLNRYLLEYPNSKPDGTHDFLYWEKVNFGLKPTIRLNHGMVYRAPGLDHRVYVLAIKQLYASHYFQTALDLSFCVPRSNASEEDGFYLITVKASRQAGLTGLKGGLIRKIAVSKTRSSLERALNSIKQNLERPIEPARSKGGR
ncbi:MAG: hypothetical protein LAP86_25440 [Acidobacteriia bacterium]|nr:hypothetical protein [Terriglobia bacterium]